jgi:dipeptidase
MELMRDHFGGTELDMTKDAGAGPYALPYRWRPLTWKVEGREFFNERAVSTQQTGFSFVAQARSWLPDPIGGVLWFGVDDSYSTVYVPMYCGITRVPHGFAVGTGSFHEFTWESAFWVFNAVSNFAYLRYAAHDQGYPESAARPGGPVPIRATGSGCRGAGSLSAGPASGD